MEWCFLIPGIYTITETDPGNMWIVEIIGSPATVPAGGKAYATVNNTYIPPGCTHTWGYWKTHAGYGPQPMHPAWGVLGGPLTPFFGTTKTYYEILEMSPLGGNAYIILAHQYIATELNGLDPDNPSLPDFVNENMTSAALLLQQYEGDIYIPKDSPDRAIAIYIAGILDDFNNGLLGWPHCDDQFTPFSIL
jgi:hypothetical protein